MTMTLVLITDRFAQAGGDTEAQSGPTDELPGYVLLLAAVLRAGRCGADQ